MSAILFVHQANDGAIELLSPCASEQEWQAGCEQRRRLLNALAPAAPPPWWLRWINALAEARRWRGVRQARQAGGRARANARRAEKLMPAVLKPVLDRLLDALPRIEDGSLDARQAQAMASVAGAAVRVLTAGQLEERLAALEAAQQARTEGGGG